MPKNTTRKQTKQVAEKPMAVSAVENDDDWGSGSILVKTPGTATRSKKKTADPRTVHIPQPIPEWEQVGMKEEDYKAMQERTAKQMRQWQIENYTRNFIEDLDSISFWERRIESLETTRERYNQKRGWSAADVSAVQQIDAEIQECENEIARIESYDDFDNDQQVSAF